MSETIMVIAGILFAILFSFLLFVFLVVIIAIFKRQKNQSNYMPDISVIAPTYNEELNIFEFITSIYNQDYPKEKIELIIVDDGSTDKTLEIARTFPIKVLTQEHKGKSEALNLGVKNSTHDFIITIDADTFLEKNCLREMVKPFSDASVGATTGNSKVKNKKSILGSFQNVEYAYNNLVRISFSKVFKDGVWFFGALAGYRKEVIEKAGYFKQATLSEDTDIALEITGLGYRVISVPEAICHTMVPSSMKSLYKQRERWWIGTLQSLVKNKKLFLKSSTPLKFLFVNHFWWSFYAFISLPIIVYQINYWLPYNNDSIASLASYLIRWFSLLGPVYVIYKIPEWGLSFYSIFGVLSGIISSFTTILALKLFKDKLSVRNILGLVFFFPYTIFLNTFIILSLIKYPFSKKRFFIR